MKDETTSRCTSQGKITRFSTSQEGSTCNTTSEGDTHMQVPDADFAIKAPGGHQAGDCGVKGHTPGGSTVAH